MLTNNNIVSIGTHHAKDAKELSSQNKKIIASCRIILSNSLPKCFVFLSNLDDTLFKLADQAKNNLEQSEYFNVMRLFRIQQDNLQNEFTRLVLNDFDTFFSTSINTDSLNSASKLGLELSILQDDDLEEEIAITRIATKSSEVFGNEFSQLSSRFAYLINTKTISKNPLAAESIAAHLKGLISPITSNLAIKLQAYKQFEQQAIGELKSLCLQLNDELIKHQILPNLAQRKRSQQHSATPPTQSFEESVSSQSNSMPNQGGDDQSTSAIFEQLRQSLNRNGSLQTQNNGNSTFNTADQQSILSALSELQQMPSGQVSMTQNGSYQLPELRQLLAGNLQADAQSVSHVDEDTINVIDLLFEFILEDKIIPAPIRAMIARLQIPMLKVAIRDKKFFSTKNHPARRLLNNLAKISTGWNQQRSSQQDLTQNKIETIVTTILAEFDTDISLFEELNNQLKLFIDQQGQSSTVAEQRIVKENEGQEKLIAAQQEVDRVINTRLSQYSHLPKVVISLIDDGWKHVLKLRLLQKGLDSPEWRDSVKLLDQLIWSVQPKSDPNDRQQLLQIIPHLVEELKANLSGASFNQPKIRSHFEALQICHTQCVNGDNLQQEVLQAIEIPPDASNIIEEAVLPLIAAEKKILSDDEALEKATALKIGTWLEISEEGSSRQMKFSWRSNITGHCLFVTHQGLKAADLSLTELAGLFQNGQAQIIDQFEPLMDRALVSMMAAINNQPNSTEK
tara:strand:+ start:80772 stop:82982 length:2211 start_codon:yes stop_codon:yes gene_type:complete